MLLYLPPPFTHLSSSLASLLPFSSCFPQHLISLFCSVESCVWFLTFPQWHLKCFLVQNILFIAIETGSSVWKKKKKKSGSLKLCNPVILPKSINGNILGEMQKPAAWGNKRRKGHPFLGNLHRFETLVESRTAQACAERISALPLHGRELPVESGEVRQNCILLSVLPLKSCSTWDTSLTPLSLLRYKNNHVNIPMAFCLGSCGAPVAEASWHLLVDSPFSSHTSGQPCCWPNSKPLSDVQLRELPMLGIPNTKPVCLPQCSLKCTKMCLVFTFSCKT